MDKRVLIILSLFLALTITIFITYSLSGETIGEQREALEKEEIILLSQDIEIIINLEDLKTISEEFEAVLDTSTSKASVHKYMGAQLKDILSQNKIDIKDKKAVILSGVDGYSVAYSLEEVLQDENVYIAYMEDGKYISFQSIVTSDMFSNRRCKWLIKIEVK